MGAGASTDLTKDQLKEKYAEVKHRLYPQQQASLEALFESSENPAEILEAVNAHLNDAEVPSMDFDAMPEFTDKHISLMAKHLTPDLFAELQAHRRRRRRHRRRHRRRGYFRKYCRRGCFYS